MEDKIIFYPYPSIEQFNNAVKSVRSSANYHGVDQKDVNLTFIGTTKLHGTNASVILNYQKQEKEPIYQVQSRVNILSIEKDNAGFAFYAYKHEKIFTDKLKAILADFIVTNTEGYKEEDIMAIGVYGEWAGQNIQKGVAICNLDKFFAPFDVAVYVKPNEKEKAKLDISKDPNLERRFIRLWLDQEVVSDFSFEEARIFPISKVVEPHIITINFDPVNLAKTSEFLAQKTQEVEDCDPFAKHFGFDGVGEGIVWKIVKSDNNTLDCGDIRFKVKGEKHSASKVKTLAPVDFEKVAKLQEAVDKFATVNRLNQGLDYLKENHIEIDIKNTSHFIKWVNQDILKEEKETILVSDLEWKKLSGLISKKAALWFKNQLDNF